MNILREIVLKRSNIPQAILLTISLGIGSIIIIIHHNAYDLKNPSPIDTIFKLQLLIFYILTVAGSFFPIIFFLRNKNGPGNRIVIKQHSIILPNNNWIINPFIKKEKEISFSDIKRVELDDQTLKYHFKKIKITTKESIFRICDRDLLQNDFIFIENFLMQKINAL